MDIPTDDKAFIPYFEEDDGYDWGDEDAIYYARPQTPITSAIPNVHIFGQPLTDEDLQSFGLSTPDDYLDESEWTEDPSLSEDSSPPSPTLQASPITIGSRLLSQLTKKKREQFLQVELEQAWN